MLPFISFTCTVWKLPSPSLLSLHFRKKQMQKRKVVVLETIWSVPWVSYVCFCLQSCVTYKPALSAFQPFTTDEVTDQIKKCLCFFNRTAVLSVSKFPRRLGLCRRLQLSDGHCIPRTASLKVAPCSSCLRQCPLCDVGPFDLSHGTLSTRMAGRVLFCFHAIQASRDQNEVGAV